MWGIGTFMIIFLAAILEVPRHLYESAELDGAGPFQKLRWVTLPTISPVILFSVVLGVIYGLQYFTQAFVAASIAGGNASQAGSVSSLELGYPEGSTLFYPILLYYHGFKYFNMGYASRARGPAARRLVRGHAGDHPQLAALGALRRGDPLMDVSRPLPRRSPADEAPAAIRRRRFLVAVADHSILIGVAIASSPRSCSSG